MRIRDRVVLITGASEGIGAACSRVFAARGARLALTARNEARLREAGGAGALILPGDLLVERDRERIVAETVRHYGRLDVLVANAGIGLYAPTWQASMEEARRMFELNFFSVLSLAQLAVPHMRAQGGGVIAGVSSIAGRVTLPWLTLYSASKTALIALMDGLRMELAPHNIRTVSVCPGYVKTQFQDHVLGGRPPQRIREAREFAITAEQCAEAIARGVERERRTVVAPGSGRLLIGLRALLPRLVDAQLARIYHGLEPQE